jgi:hypothetical protein
LIGLSWFIVGKGCQPLRPERSGAPDGVPAPVPLTQVMLRQVETIVKVFVTPVTNRLNNDVEWQTTLPIDIPYVDR